MKACDMREVEPGTTLFTDLAIVGSGPAGLSLAHEFIGTHTRVVLLESGGLNESAAIAPSEKYESTGAPRCMEPRKVRNRVFGGSSHTWSGKCRTFDEIDFESREWVPYSGWPISRADVLPYFDRAAALMHLGPNVYDEALWTLLGKDPPKSNPRHDGLDACFWQFARDPGNPMEFLRFGPHFLAREAANIQILVNATVTHINTNPNGRKLVSLEVTSAHGRTVSIVPKVVVLAAGGIENARLLLASNRLLPNGVGNDNDLVGRFLMDHPRTSLGEYAPRIGRLVEERLGLFLLKHNGKNHFYSPGLALSPARQRGEHLLNCAAYLSEHRAEDDPWDAMKRLYKRQSQNYLRDSISAFSDPRLLMSGICRRVMGGRNITHKLDRLAVDCLVEQVPDPESRITLSERRDELGLSIAHLQWKISELERRTVAALAHAFAGEMISLGLPSPTPPDWLPGGDLDAIEFTDTAHPTGTTRMDEDPSRGVVDRNCQLHGVGGVFIAGSSVFPTASHANPTLTIVAMALRLADHLKDADLR
ncbi:choline dehydrogenase-like flavoprotein [Sinorhizobium fredii]